MQNNLIKSQKISIHLLYGLLAVFLFTSCAPNSVNTIENADKTMQPHFVRNKRVITDTYLADRLSVIRVDKSYTNDGLLVVQVTMKNMRTGWFSSETPYRIVYHFSWFNKQGIETVAPDDPGWQEIYIIPGDSVTVKGIAPNKNCRDFLLHLKALN